jgi:hypothetical protein
MKMLCKIHDTGCNDDQEYSNMKLNASSFILFLKTFMIIWADLV